MEQKDMSRLTLSVDENVKAAAKILFRAYGTNMQDVVTGYLESVVEAGEPTFRITRAPGLRGIGITDELARALGLDREGWPLPRAGKENVVVRIDPALRGRADAVVADWGISLSGAVSALFRQCVYEMRIVYREVGGHAS